MNIIIPPDKVHAWVSRYFPNYKQRKSGAELRINNPFNGDTNYHLNISTEKAACHDFRGNSWAGHNSNGVPQKCTFLRFVQLYLIQSRGRCTFAEAVADVLGASSGALAQIKWHKTHAIPEQQEKTSLKLPDGIQKFDVQSKLSDSLMSWLSSRGVDLAKIYKYNIMYSGFDVVWPYYEYDDDPVYWQSRSRLNKVFRFPPESIGVTKSQFLYGFDQIEPASHLIITESIFNTLTLEDQCVASGGATLGEMQIKKIQLLGPKDGVILAPDHDKAGIESIEHNSKLLRKLGYKIFYALPPIVKLPSGKSSNDWNDLVQVMSIPEIQKIFESSIKRLNDQQEKYLNNRLKQLFAIPR